MASSHQSGYAGGHAKARKYDLAQTNIGMLGSDLEKAVKQYAAETEAAWKNVGKTAGLHVWRIEKFKIVEQSSKQCGKFYTGDSYIILHTHKKNNSSEALAWDIHFWIGSESTQDEYGTAAYKTVELDDFLQGKATQFREVQSSESRKFKEIFPNVVYLEGGIESGFNIVKPTEYRHRLLQIKGKLNTIAQEVPLKQDSLNEGDSFVLDAGLAVHVWHGKQAGQMEKTKAIGLAQALNDERGGKVARTISDSGSDKEFFDALGQKRGTIKSAEEGGSDEAAPVGSKRLCKVSDASGAMQLTEIASGSAINRAMLHSADIFILDDGYEVTVWVGLGASVQERRQAMPMAATYLKKYGRPLETPISKVLEGGENELFEAAFEFGVSDGKTRSKEAAASAHATYKGSGGPGVATDFDKLYAAEASDPNAWSGRAKGTSAFAKELEAGGHGAYAAGSGFASGLTAEQRAQKGGRVTELEAQHASARKSAAQPTLVALPGFDAATDAQALRKAMAGLGTNEKALVQILGKRTFAQRAQIAVKFAELFKGHDLEKDLRSELSGNLRALAIALVQAPTTRVAEMLHFAMKGPGTDESLVADVLCTHEAAEIAQISQAYHEMFKKDLLQDVLGETSGNFAALLRNVLTGTREPSTAPVNAAAAADDVAALLKAGEKRLGTDEAKFIDILLDEAQVFSFVCQSEYSPAKENSNFYLDLSFPHIAQMIHAYDKTSSMGFLQALESELSGDFLLACTTIARHAIDENDRVILSLFKSMDGRGTRDNVLINLIVDHCEKDMVAIKADFPGRVAALTKKPGVQLKDMIAGDTSGCYKDLLLTLIGEDSA